jgi:ribonuclease T2
MARVKTQPAPRAFLALAAAGVVLGLVCAEALAQRVPYRERPGLEQSQERGERKQREHEAGVFDYYVLTLSWSPTFCADLGNDRYEPQCHAREGRRYAFVLHGLWPQYERGWPQNCRSADRGYVPRPVAQRMLDIMPSDRLVFHQYRKHGTCSGLGVDGYFDLARRLHDKVKIPRRYVGLAEDRLMVSRNELMREFLAANPGLKPDMIAVACGGPGHRLKEVRICFDKAGAFQTCGRNEDQHRLCAAERMYVPPVRTGADGPAQPGQPSKSIVPGPRDERRL